MNKLPACLFILIDEFAHGDRNYWKSQYRLVRQELSCFCNHLFTSQQTRHQKAAQKVIGATAVTIHDHLAPDIEWMVTSQAIISHDGAYPFSYHNAFSSFDEALVAFHQQVCEAAKQSLICS